MNRLLSALLGCLALALASTSVRASRVIFSFSQTCNLYTDPNDPNCGPVEE